MFSPDELHYDVLMYWSEVDQVYIAEVPELPGCMSHGDTRVAALENVQEAIALWVEGAIEDGEEVPKPGRRMAVS